MPQSLNRDAVRAAVEAWCDAAPEAGPFVPGQTPVPVSGKIVGKAERLAMVEAALDGWLTTGRFNEAFEQRLAAWFGLPRALTVNSGSSANLVAVSSLFSPRLGATALRPGDEIITVAAGFPTTVNPILQNGAIPVFVDIRPGTYDIDVDRLEAARTPRTRAIVLAHTLGNPFDLTAVTDFCARHGLWLVEDCCDALGSRYRIGDDAPAWQARMPDARDPTLWCRTAGDNARERHVGAFGHYATVSFYPAHHITMGEGGAVLSCELELAGIAESIRDWGRDCWCAPGCDNTCGRRFDWQLGELPRGYDHKYTYSHLGYNLKISDMQAACALAQMDRLEAFVAARRRNFAHLSQRFADCEDVLILPRATGGSTPSWFGFPLTLKPEAGVDRVEMLRWLDQHRIASRLLFAGNLTRQPYMAGRDYRVAGSLEVTDRVMNDTFWIGVWPGLDEAMLDYAADRIRLFLGRDFE